MARTTSRDPQHDDGSWSLRRITTVAVLVIAAMAAFVSMSLVVLTTDLHSANGALREALRGANVARDAEVDLLVHARATDPIVRDRLESGLTGTLSALGDPARARIERYLETARDRGGAAVETEAQLEAAIDTLEQAVRANTEDAARARNATARVDKLGDAIGYSAAVLLIGIPALLAVWIRRSVLRPMLTLSTAMEHFRNRDLAVRSTAGGAAEIRGMTRQFNAMAEHIQREQGARLTHLAGVAHDLRNPLAALQMSSALVDADRPLPPEHQVRRAFAVVRRQVARLTRMVDDLLDATRVEAGQLTIELLEVDLRPVVRDVGELFERASELHSVRVELPDEPLVVRCDAQRIEQTLTNLVSNAIKYSPRGGVVRIVARREGDTAQISVSDQGGGIPAWDMDGIWEPFRRKGVSQESISGVGLGLWTAQRIVHAHDGKITVESEVGLGSTFTIALPLASTSPLRASEHGVRPHEMAGRRRLTLAARGTGHG